MAVTMKLLWASMVLLASTSATPEIDHVVILMLENRAFDHMLGFLKTEMPDLDGCLPNRPGCDNPLDPADPNSERITVDNQAHFIADADPDHSIHGQTFEIYGHDQSPPWPKSAPMDGFVKRYSKDANRTEDGRNIMKCFDPSHVPAITTLAKNFAVFDKWHPAIPGPTMPNRIFAASATSHGLGTNDVETLVEGMPQKTIFENMADSGYSWGVFFEEVPSNIVFKNLRKPENLEKFHPLLSFYDKAKKGDLPTLSWLEPRYYEIADEPATDQHPNHDVSAGDALIKKIYDAVRKSPKWEKTMLIVTYDENGGFFDHVPPPLCPSPDGINSTDPDFDFTRLGIRIPTIVASPYIKAGTIVSAPGTGGTAPGPTPTSQFEASSISATLKKLFNLPSFLTKRDAWAGTFEGILQEQARDDCPETLPEPPVHRLMESCPLPSFDQLGQSPLNELQQMFAEVLSGITGEPLPAGLNEHAAADWVSKRMHTILKKGKAAEQ